MFLTYSTYESYSISMGILYKKKYSIYSYVKRASNEKNTWHEQYLM